MNLIQWAGIIVAAILQIAVISVLLRGGIRRYPFLFLLMVVDLLGLVASLSAILDVGTWTRQTAKIYWIHEGIQFIVLFAAQAHMLYQASEKHSAKRLAYLILGGALFAVLATWSAYHPKFSLYMTQLERNFSFGCMLLNLAIWTTLLRSYDKQRLLISAAFGLLLAGAAIGHSLRQLSPSLVSLGNFLITSLYILYVFLLFRALTKLPATVALAPDQRNQIPQPSTSPLH